MAKVKFSFDEMVYNSVVQGKQIYYGTELKTIDYVKLEKKSRQILVICTDGTVFPTMQDGTQEWEVNNIKEFKIPNKPKK